MASLDHETAPPLAPPDPGWAAVDQLHRQALELLTMDAETALGLIEEARRRAEAIGYRRGVAAGLALLGRHHYQRGAFDEARQCLRAALAALDDGGDPTLLAECHTGLARLERDAGNHSEALGHVDRALGLCQPDPASGTRADALNIKASLLNAEGQYAAAITVLEEVLRLKRAQHDPTGEATALLNLGITLTDVSDFGTSLERFSQARALIARLGNPLLEAQCSLNIGGVYHEIGDFALALGFYEECLEQARAGSAATLEVIALGNIGDVCYGYGRYAEAAGRFREALERSRAIGLTHVEASILDGLGKTYRGLGRFAEALAIHEETLATATATGNSRARVEALFGLGCTHLESGEHRRAVGCFEGALEVALATQQLKPAFEAHQRLAECHERLGDTARALGHFKAYHDLEREVFNEETARKTRNLALQLDLERAHGEAEVYRLRTEVTEQANAMLEEKVRERTQELEEARVEVLMRLALAAEYRDDHTGEHTWRVGRTSALIAGELGLPADQVELLRLAARLHDVGKIGISDLIMLKPDRLTAEEFERMKSHTTIGAEILSGGKTPLLQMAQRIALTHHERWDGSGYPHGLSGDAIPIVGRIVAVADVFDALLSERPYKRPWTFAEARDEIAAKSGSQFDPAVVAAFDRLLQGGVVLDQP